MLNINGSKNIKLRKAAVIILFVIATLLVIFVLNGNGNVITKPLISVELYYMNQDNSGMQAEVRRIPDSSEREILQKTLSELQAGSKNEGFVQSVPQDISFTSAILSDHVVSLDISRNYHNMTPGEEMICRAALVWTLTSLPFVDYVNISVEGSPITKADGTPIGNMNRENVVINTVISPETKRYEAFELYFANEEGTGLLAEKREIEVSQNQPKERSVIEQLIAGPSEDLGQATIPPETKIREITTTDDGICYVNLSSDFVGKKDGGTEVETLTIYSVVNSLVGLPYIDKVQFLIEGEKLENYKGHVDISKPVGEKNSLIVK